MKESAYNLGEASHLSVKVLPLFAVLCSLHGSIEEYECFLVQNTCYETETLVVCVCC